MNNRKLNVLSDSYILEQMTTVEECQRELDRVNKEILKYEEDMLQINNSNVICIKGTTEFMGVEIPNVYGGFGEGKKAITDKHIAEVHDMEAKNVRSRITKHIKRFKEGVDYIDLLDCDFTAYGISSKEILKSLGYTDVAIRNAEHIYLLSERGYAKLIKIMDTDLAWEIHDQLIDEYFQMREVIQNGNLPSYQIEDDEQRALMWVKERKRDKYEKLKIYRRALEERMEKLRLKPIADYTINVLNPSNAIKLLTVTDISKDLGMSAQALNLKLHKLGVQYKRGGYWKFYSKYDYLIPEYADYVIDEYGQYLKWTEKGRQWIIEFLEKNDKEE